MELLNALSRSSPELIWGLVSRGIGLVFLISFASLSSQVLPTAGKNGITPVAEILHAIERDFPTFRRFLYFPNLLWVSVSDGFLGSLPWLGALAASVVILGGPAAPWAMGACYVIYLSLDRAMVLVFPWDCALFEAGFWGMFLPATRLLPDLTATAAPLPAVAWVFRLLVFRIMFGFGKHKFIGTTSDDKGFLKSFFINQPLPTVFGWLTHHLPMWALRLALLTMFVVEIPLPFTVFFPGPWSVVGGVATILLMVAIELTGNFGYFNIAMMVLSLSWLDTRTALALRPSDVFSLHGPVLVHALVLAHLALALLALPFNTFCAQTWMLWPFWERVRPRFLIWPVRFARALHPLRFAHGYGVFPPRSLPAAKALPVLEATWDGETWLTVEQPHSPTLETSRPTFCAPHHNRVDQAIVYEGLGINEASVMRNFAGRFDPYGYGCAPGALRLLHRFVEGTAPGRGFYDRTLEEEHGPPLAGRVRTYLFEPTSIAEVRETGKWWQRTLIGPHFPPMKRGEGFWAEPLATPELFHPDDLVWLKRSRLGALMRRSARGEDPHALVLLAASGLDVSDVARFWDDFLPEATAPGRHDWAHLRATVTELRARYDRRTLHRFERVAGCYAVLLLARLEPLFADQGLRPAFGKGEATLNAKSAHHLRLLCNHVVSAGRDAYDRVLRDPLVARTELDHFTMQSGSYLPALFRYEAYVYQSYKLRLLHAYDHHEGRTVPDAKQKEALDRLDAVLRSLYGSLDVADFLKTQFTAEHDVLDTPERWPRFTVRADGEVKRLQVRDA